MASSTASGSFSPHTGCEVGSGEWGLSPSSVLRSPLDIDSGPWLRNPAGPISALARPSPQTPTQRLAQSSDVLLPEACRYARAPWGSGSNSALGKVTRGRGLIAVSAAIETDEDGWTLETPRPPTVDDTSGESVELTGNPSQLAGSFGPTSRLAHLARRARYGQERATLGARDFRPLRGLTTAALMLPWASLRICPAVGSG
jgi:hypothetical protein